MDGALGLGIVFCYSPLTDREIKLLYSLFFVAEFCFLLYFSKGEFRMQVPNNPSRLPASHFHPGISSVILNSILPYQKQEFGLA